VWSIGYGATRDANGNPVCSTTPCVSVAKELVECDLRSAFATVQRDVNVPLTPEQTAAHADFVYNLGAVNLSNSTLLKKLNAGDYERALPQSSTKWDYAGGKMLAGLLRRRKAEKKLFDEKPAPAAPVASSHPRHQPHPRHPLAPLRGVGLAESIVRYATWSWCAHVGFQLQDGHILDAAPDNGVSIHMVPDDPGTQVLSRGLP
jgi:lysozyme